jgi:hypothetical protein
MGRLNKDRFDKAFKKTVIPTLRALGFTGSHPTFRRDDEDGKVVVLVNIQASSGGDGCYVNLGAHHRALKNRHTDWEKLREYQCAFRARLDNVAGDSFFGYGTSDKSTDLQAQSVSEMLKTEGKMWLDQLSSADALADTLKTLAKEGLDSFIPYGPPAAADTFRKLAKALGDTKSERAFLAQAKRDEEERARAREEEERERAATTIQMTEEAYRAARKAGTIPNGATIQLIFTPKTKKKEKPKPKPKVKAKSKRASSQPTVS